MASASKSVTATDGKKDGLISPVSFWSKKRNCLRISAFFGGLIVWGAGYLVNSFDPSAPFCSPGSVGHTLYCAVSSHHLIADRFFGHIFSRVEFFWLGFIPFLFVLFCVSALGGFLFLWFYIFQPKAKKEGLPLFKKGDMSSDLPARGDTAPVEHLSDMHAVIPQAHAQTVRQHLTLKFIASPFAPPSAISEISDKRA